MKTLIWFVLVVCCSVLVPAQERVIEKAEFDAALTTGYSHKVAWKGEKYRQTVSTSSKVAGRPQTDYSSKNITEFGASDETRTVSSSVFGGTPTAPREFLRIGKWSYTRSGNDPWVRKEYAPSGASATDKEQITHKTLSSNVEYKYLGQSTLLNKAVHVYVKTERRTSLNEKSGEASEIDSKNTYWIDDKGILLKSEFASENRGKITSQTSVIMVWEIDPSISFNAPEITP